MNKVFASLIQLKLLSNRNSFFCRQQPNCVKCCIFVRSEMVSSAVVQVKWMMYWIVFALFTFAETLADTFVSWSVSVVNIALAIVFIIHILCYIAFLVLYTEWAQKNRIVKFTIISGVVKICRN